MSVEGCISPLWTIFAAEGFARDERAGIARVETWGRGLPFPLPLRERAGNRPCENVASEG
ncbi:hypothetical protein D9M73_189980 [compost metagenome]